MIEYLILTDEGLMARVIEGDHQAFSALVRRHASRFFATAYRMTGRQQDAEDIVQDAFLKLWRDPDKWDAGKGVQFTTWFYRVVSNQALDHIRKRKPEYGTDNLSHFPDPKTPIDREILENEQQKYLEGAIQGLPERQKEALNLCFYEELSNKEAAGLMGVSVKALESLLMRAKKALKDSLIRDDILEDKQGIREKRYG